MLLGERPLLANAISNGGRPCHLLYVVVQDFVEKAACCGRPSATVVRLLNAIVGRKNFLPHNFADLGNQPFHQNSCFASRDSCFSHDGRLSEDKKHSNNFSETFSP
jgi:hypothetical protein